MTDNNKNEEIHVGNLIKTYIDANRIYKSSLAKNSIEKTVQL